MWQDSVLAVAQLTFAPSMIPTLRGPDKPALSTSVLNAVIVTVIATTQGTLGLWRAVATSSLIALIWTVLAVQKFRIDRTVKASARATDATNKSERQEADAAQSTS